MVEQALYRAQNGEAKPLYLQAIENLTDKPQYIALKALADKPVSANNAQAEQATEAQCNDGWIKHNGIRQPVNDDIMVMVKFSDGSVTSKGRAGQWEWRNESSYPEIREYRIIPEAKEQPECKCWDYNGSNFKCPLCEPEEKEEPQEQTLWEFLTKSEIQIIHPELLKKISEYIERNKRK